MEKLILLSDLWGAKKSGWIENYTTLLDKHFDIRYYDCCELGEIDLTDYSEENIHQQFLNGGIEKAVENLLKKEKEVISILGFSIGGSIAWKAAYQGLKVDNFIAVSSTRLRYEDERPRCNIELYYGENDQYQPETDWFNNFKLNPKIYKNETHDFYLKKEIAENICKDIIENHSGN